MRNEPFSARYSIDPETGCWIWQRATSADGYGRVSVGGKVIPAHRRAYELLVGPIPKGLTIDHLCRNRPCVNPDHLEPVTNRENILRGNTLPAANAAKTHCKYGHPFSPENTWHDLKRGWRKCRTCMRASTQEWREKQAA
jgi:hypothetical protein